jgi:hypothetical protein
LSLRNGHTPLEHQSFGAPADRAPQGGDTRLAGAGRGKIGLAQAEDTRRFNPQGAARNHTELIWFLLDGHWIIHYAITRPKAKASKKLKI